MKNWGKELLHYVVVYGALLASWVPLMDYFGGNVNYTAGAGLAVFIAADLVAHRFILNER